MDFFESSEDVDEQLASTHRQLDALNGDVPRTIALTRLKNQTPFHPVLLLRIVALAAAGLCLVAALLAFLVPYMGALIDPSLPATVRRIELAMGGTPLPIAIAGGGALLLISWFAIDQAAVSIGRACHLSPAEKREESRLTSELTRLNRQRDMIQRANRPSIGGVQYTVPQPDTAPPSQYGAPDAAPSYLAPPSMPPQMGQVAARTNTPVPARTNDGYARFRTPATNGREVVPIAKPTVISLQPTDRRRNEPSVIEAATDQFASHDAYKAADAEPSYVIEDTDDAMTASTHRADMADIAYVTDSQSSHGGFERRRSSDVPALARVSEDWLQDAIQKATFLAESFPIQARLEFSQDQHVPFTLVLERATPAMAVRAMMAFVEFLSTIARPRHARIELASVAHLDRTFHRNVRAACSPYFPDGVEIANEPGRIGLTFRNPDARWDRYPVLPLSE